MEFRFFCPLCGRKLKADEESAGMKVDCPDCGTEFLIPQFADTTAPKPPEVFDVPLYNRTVAAPVLAMPIPKPKPAIKHGSGICGDCAEMSVPKTQLDGSISIEIVLWLFFLLPGMIYSCWRFSTRRLACRHCRGKMFTLTSPKGRAMLKQYHNTSPELLKS